MGATSKRIVRLILGEGVKALAIGLAGGVAIAYWTSTVAAGLWFGLTPGVPVTLAGSPGLPIRIAEPPERFLEPRGALPPAFEASAPPPVGVL